MVTAMRSSKRHSLVLCAIAWEMASFTMMSPERSVIMSLYMRGLRIREEYSKWNSSVSNSCSLRGPEAKTVFVSEAANVKSARTS